MNKVIEWTMTSGKKAKVTVELVTEKVNYCDGHNITTSCCDLNVTGEAEGRGIMGHYVTVIPAGHPASKCISNAAGLCGMMVIPQPQYDEIMAAIADAKATPEWVEKVRKENESIKADNEYYGHRNAMRNAMAE